MSAVTGPVDWGAYSGEQLDQVMALLLLQERRNARHRRPSRGDGGVDVYDPISGEYDVYQIKRYSASLTSRQKTDIRDSLEAVRTAPRLDGPVREWALVLPLDPTSGDDEWFRELTKDAPFPCRWLGRTFWDSEAAKHPHVIDYVLRGGRDRLVRRVHELTSLLREPDQPIQPGELGPALLRLRNEVNREDPHYFYDLHLTQDPWPNASRPGLVLSRSEGAPGEGFVTVEVFSKYPQAVYDRPVTGNMTIVLRDEERGIDLLDDWRALEDYGRELHLPAEVVPSLTLDAPGGLGGSFEGVEVTISGSTGVMLADKLVLTVVDPGGAELATASLVIEKSATAASKGVGVEATGPAFDIVLSLGIPGADRRATSNLNLMTHEFAGARASEVLPHLRFLAGFSPPNRLLVSLRKSGQQVAGAAVAVDQLGFSGRPSVTSTGLQLTEILADLEQLLGVIVPIPAALDDNDRHTLGWVWQLARGEVVEGTWSQAKCVMRDPDAILAALERGDIIRVDQLERFRFAGAEYPLGVVAQILYGAKNGGTREVETGTEIVMQAADGRVEERLVQPYKAIALAFE